MLSIHLCNGSGETLCALEWHTVQKQIRGLLKVHYGMYAKEEFLQLLPFGVNPLAGDY